MNEQAIFLAAVEIADLPARADYVKRACAGDAALERRVASLLAAHERSGEFLDVPALRQVAGAASPTANPAVTSAEQPNADEPNPEVILAFLEPSTAPGSLGRLGHYEVQEIIGRGGCGIVLKAFDETLHRVVAIKVMAPELALTSPARKRFLREARAAAAIRHENVISIYAVEDQPIPFLVMEYIAGQTLQQKLDQTGPLDVQEVVRIGQQIASGLEAAHARGLIHRDIKPGNILLEQGRDHVKLTDFGLARASDDASLTQSGVIAGTPLYMSPEQAQGDVIDQRSDLFSLGSVLYVMCSGRPPFRAPTTLAVLKRVADDEPRPIQEIIPEVPQWLSALIAKLHAKQPADRFSSAQEVASLLAREGVQPEAAINHPAPKVERAAPAVAAKAPAREEHPTPSSHSWLAVAAAVLVALLIGLSLTEAAGVTELRATVVRLFSPEGTLVVEVDDPGVSVSIDGAELVITGAGAKEIRLKPGQHKLLASKDGKVVSQELVTVTTHGRQVVRVSLEAESTSAIGNREKTEASLPKFKSPLGMEFALVPKGKSRLGGGDGKVGDQEIEFQEDFYLGVYPVTQAEWELVTGLTPSHFSRTGAGKNLVQSSSDADLKRFPVENVSWNEAQLFLNLLNKRDQQTGWKYRLPTEAEWEYAVRDGSLCSRTDSAFDFYFDQPTNQLASGQANFGKGDQGQPCPVGSYKPNRLGLHDMHGNVHEWCEDRVPDPRDPQGPSHRVLRGGSYWSAAQFCRAANRFLHLPDYRQSNIGLRVARVRAESATPPQPTIALSIPQPAPVLEALRRDQVSPAALALAGNGDASQAPASLVGVLGEPQTIHTKAVNSLAFSPDGRWLASASQDQTILLRDTTDGRVQRVLRGHSGPVVSVAFSKDNQTLISASHDGTLKLWPVEKAAEPETVAADLGEIVSMSLSGDERFLAAGGSNKTVKLWKWGEWKEPVHELTLSDKLSRLALSSDGELLAVGVIGMRKGEGEQPKQAPIAVYRTGDMQLQWTLPASGEWKPEWSWNIGLVFSPDGKFLYTAGLAIGMKKWDLSSGMLLHEIKDVQSTWALPAAPVISADGQMLVYSKGVRINVLKAADMSWGRSTINVQGDQHSIEAAALSSNGKRLAVGTSDGSVLVWDTDSWRQPFLATGHPHTINTVSISPDAKSLLTTGAENALRHWDLDRWGGSQQLFEDTNLVRAALYAPNGKTFVTSHGWEWFDFKRREVIWDAETNKESHIPENPVFGFGITYSPDGKLLAAGGDNVVQLWDAADGRKLRRFEAKGSLASVAFSSDGKLLVAVTLESRAVLMWDVATGEERFSLKYDPATGGSPCYPFLDAAVFLPQSPLLATGHADGMINLWNTDSGEKQRRLIGHTDRVKTLRFTPDGKTLISSAHDGTIRLWNTDETKAREVISLGPTNAPLTFDLDPSGKYLFAVGRSPVVFVLRLPSK